MPATAAAAFVIDDPSQVGEARRAAQTARRAASFDERGGRQRRHRRRPSSRNNLVACTRGGGELLHPARSRDDDERRDRAARDRSRARHRRHRALPRATAIRPAARRAPGSGAVRRLASEFDIHSACRRRHRRGGARSARDVGCRLRCVARSTSRCAGEVVCGDGWACAHGRDGMRAVWWPTAWATGPIAAEAARGRASRPSPPTRSRRPRDIAAARARGLRSTRGAAVAMCCSRCRRRHGAHAPASATSPARSCPAPATARMLVAATARRRARSARSQQFDYPRGPPTRCWSCIRDGIARAGSSSACPGLLGAHPAIVAGGAAVRDHCRGRDDATVVVVGAGLT